MADIDTSRTKQKCPECSHTRQKHPNDKPLSYDKTRQIFLCHHCGFKGRLGTAMDQRYTTKKTYVKPSYTPAASPGDKLLAWFKTRAIPPEVVTRHKIESRTVYVPQIERETRAIAFPYFRGGEVVNVKYRTANKDFCMESGAELILYGLDDVTDDLPLLICEGEIDRLSLEVAGYTNCVSVPNGAGTNLDCLANAESYLEPIKKIIFAGDNDEAGKRLEAETIRRLGPERCWRVEWPEGCKDANDVLMAHGADVLADCIESAKPVPIEGAFEISEILPDIIDLYDNGRPRGEHPGWDNLEALYRPRAGDWTVVTGTPGSGKSAFVAALLVNLALRSKWQFVVYPPENLPPQEYASMLMEIYVGEPFGLGPRPRMNRATMLEAAAWVDKHFVILNPVEGDRSVDGLLRLARSFVFRRGVNGFIIDPWNELEHLQPEGLTETQYIGQSLIKIRQFARTYRLHVWVIAHPTKLHKNDNGSYPVPTLYDCSGSAHWFNKSDMGISVWRDKSDESKPVEIHVQKVRFRWCGQLGMAQLYFDKPTGRYSEAQHTQPYYGSELVDADDGVYN